MLRLQGGGAGGEAMLVLAAIPERAQQHEAGDGPRRAAEDGGYRRHVIHNARPMPANVRTSTTATKITTKRAEWIIHRLRSGQALPPPGGAGPRTSPPRPRAG